MKEERSIKDLMERMFDSYKMSDKLHETSILKNWEELMGKTIAKNTKRLWVNKKTLYLDIISASLKNDLKYHEKTIIDKVNEFVGTTYVESIRIK